MACLDANAVQDLMAGALDPTGRAAAMEHLDGCDDCRDLISLLARAATRDAAIDTMRDSDREDRARAADAALSETVLSESDAGAARARGADPLAATATPTGGDPTRPARVTAPSQVGRVLGRYTLVERLGAGAMGVVYRAEDYGLGRSVAVKLLHRPDPALTDRLIREARSMAQVNHPNVVAVYDVGVADGITYIAMELVPGGSLRAWQATPRPIPALIEAYVAAGHGLAAAHAAGIVHRDFKPDNVLVGTDGRVRVTDFGLAAARAADEDPGLAPGATLQASAPRLGELALTHSGIVLGTPAYMAPEQFTGGNVDPRTDQFNFCVALYEALYGSRPFRGRTFDELGDNVCDGKVLPPPAGARVSGALRAIVLRGLSVRPGDRFPTMDHLLAELARDRARPWRRTAIAAAALAGALALGLGADMIVRDRVTTVSQRAFASTGVQVDRAFGLRARTFDANANQMYVQPAMRLAAAHRDQFDFGLKTEAEDLENLEKVHDELASTDWRLLRSSGDSVVVAVADYKGRLLYTSAAPSLWRTDLMRVPWLAALAGGGKEKTITLQRTEEARLAASGLLGPAPGAPLSFFFARALVLNGERSGYIVQALDARELLGDIALGDDTLLAIADLDGYHLDTLPSDLVAAAPRDGSIAEVRHDGHAYLVKSQPLTAPERDIVGHVVMARRLGGVLSGLFPGARVAFALAMIGALAGALAAALRARRITSGRR